MKQLISVIQILSALLLIGAILMQNRGTGLSATFGGEGNVYRTKRGMEKIFFIGTIVLAIVFFGTSIAQLILR